MHAPQADPPAPMRTLLRGVDVSYYQPSVDWAAVRGAGIDFVYIKASQRDEDVRFAAHWTGARAAGLLVSVYHYLDAAMPVAEQIDLFLRVYRSVEGFADLPIALDVEEARRGETPEHVTGRVLAWVWAVKEELEVTPMVYTFPAFAARYLRCPAALDLAACPLWVAHWGVETPTVPEPWSTWKAWQTGLGRVDGIAGDVDLDVMRVEVLAGEATMG